MFGYIIKRNFSVFVVAADDDEEGGFLFYFIAFFWYLLSLRTKFTTPLISLLINIFFLFLQWTISIVIIWLRGAEEQKKTKQN